MPLTKQVLSLAFEKGLNQKASDRTLNLPFMADIKNGRMEKTGEIRRRNGLDPVTDGGQSVNNVKKSLDNTATMVTTEFTKISSIAKRNEERRPEHHRDTQSEHCKCPKTDRCAGHRRDPTDHHHAL